MKSIGRITVCVVVAAAVLAAPALSQSAQNAQKQDDVEPQLAVGDSAAGIRAETPSLPPSGSTPCPNTAVVGRGANRFACLYAADIDRTTGRVRGPLSPLLEIDLSSRVPGGNNLTTALSVSDDGKTVASFANASGNKVTLTLRNVETGAGHAYSLPFQLSSLLWFHDSKSLLTTRIIGGAVAVDRVQAAGDRDEGIALGRIETATGVYTELAHIPDRWVATAISPDGQTAYAVRGIAVATDNVLIVPLVKGTANRSLPLPTNRQRIGSAVLSPDGRMFAVLLLGEPQRLLRVSKDGADPLELSAGVLTGSGAGPGSKITWTWTPDGRALLFCRIMTPESSAGGRGNPAGSQYQVVRLPADGGRPSFTGLEVTDPAAISISPDGSRIFVFSRSADISTTAEK